MRTFCRTLPLAAALLAAALSISPNAIAAEKAAVQARVAATQQVGFDVYLPLQHRDDLEKLLSNLHDDTSPLYHQWLTPAQFHGRFDAPQSSISAITAQMRASNLTAVPVSSQHIHVTGASTDVERALTTQLHTGVFASGKQTVVAATPVVPPQAVASAGAIITGLSGKLRMHSHVHRASTDNRYSTSGAYWFDDLKQAYGWPSYQAYNGNGTTIGILIDADYNPSDMNLYFGHEKLATPSISEVKVLGGGPYDPNDASFETHLDIQQSGGMAPNANIIVYNIPDLTDDSIMAGLAQIVEDNKTDVVSMSFGGFELDYTPAYNDGEDFTYLLLQENDLMAQGAAQGITFVASSGDSGALAAPPNACFYTTGPCGSYQASVNFPASSPYVVGVGGTNLKTTYTSGSLNSAYISEQAYADPLAEDIFYGTPATGGYWGSGGGNSVIFPKPLYQYLVNTGSSRARTVPDVSLHMGGCPGGTVSCSPDDSADVVVLGGYRYAVIGTSASAPAFAGLTALNVQRFGTRFGNENYYIYALAAAQNFGLPIHVFHTGIPGYNGLYSTTPFGYNRVLGNGTVVGRNFLLAPLVPAAGTPQTPSNP